MSGRMPYVYACVHTCACFAHSAPPLQHPATHQAARRRLSSGGLPPPPAVSRPTGTSSTRSSFSSQVATTSLSEALGEAARSPSSGQSARAMWTCARDGQKWESGWAGRQALGRQPVSGWAGPLTSSSITPAGSALRACEPNPAAKNSLKGTALEPSRPCLQQRLQTY